MSDDENEKRRPGRPALPKGELRDMQVRLRLRPDEHDQLQQAAGHTPLATWIRETAMEAAACSTKTK